MLLTLRREGRGAVNLAGSDGGRKVNRPRVLLTLPGRMDPRADPRAGPFPGAVNLAIREPTHFPPIPTQSPFKYCRKRTLKTHEKTPFLARLPAAPSPANCCLHSATLCHPCSDCCALTGVRPECRAPTPLPLPPRPLVPPPTHKPSYPIAPTAPTQGFAAVVIYSQCCRWNIQVYREVYENICCTFYYSSNFYSASFILQARPPAAQYAPRVGRVGKHI